ncbi:MAG: hypothetical protein AAGC93_08090 [Cyanobacteria bacterium P01_F01_bin.53]
MAYIRVGDGVILERVAGFGMKGSRSIKDVIFKVTIKKDIGGGVVGLANVFFGFTFLDLLFESQWWGFMPWKE